MENSFTNVMSKRTDYELVEILGVNSGGYQPEAMVAAKTEFEKRGLSKVDVAEIEESITLKTAEDEKSLGIIEKIMLVLYPILTFLFIYFFYDKAEYNRKKENLQSWFWKSLVARVILLILLSITDLLKF
jgi:hypothetical protein